MAAVLGSCAYYALADLGGVSSGGSSLPVCTIHFAERGDLLNQEELSGVNKIADHLTAHPETRIRLEGHTDERGNAEYNFAIGQRRADKVKGELIKLGVMESRILVFSHGEEHPIALGHDERSWSKNRRVEIKLEGGATGATGCQ